MFLVSVPFPFLLATPPCSFPPQHHGLCFFPTLLAPYFFFFACFPFTLTTCTFFQCCGSRTTATNFLSSGSGSNVLKGKIILRQLNSLDLLLSSSIWIRNTIFIHTTWADILSILTLRVFKTLHVSLVQYNFFYKSVFILHFYIYALFYPTFFIRTFLFRFLHNFLT